MRVFYRSDYISYEEGSWLNRQRESFKHKGRIRDLASHIPANGKVLDIGPGAASMLRNFSLETDWRLHAVEPNRDICQQIAKWGIVTHACTLEEANFDTGSFDAVTMIHVLEHLPDPVGTIHEIHRILKPGGLFLTEQPNFKSAARNMFRDAWWGYHAPRHLTHFTPDNLKSILEDAGFDTLSIRHPIRPACNPWSFSIRLENLGISKKVAALFGNRSPIFILLMLPFEVLLSLLKRNDVFEVLFCKR